MIVETTKNVHFECPWCSRVEHHDVLEKDTIVCEGCNRPFELYADGRVELSALWYAKGFTGYTTRRCISSYGYLPVRTLEKDTKDFVAGWLEER